VYVYLTPATAFMAAAVLKKLDRVPVVIHVQDVWPESVTESSMAPRSGVAGTLVDRSLHAAIADRLPECPPALAVIAPVDARDGGVARCGFRFRRDVVLNWTDEALFRPAPSDRGGRAGTSGIGTAAPSCTPARWVHFRTSRRRSGRPAAVADVADLVLVGSGVDEDSARRLAVELGAENVRFIGRRAPSEMAALTGVADFQLVTLRDLPIFRGHDPVEATGGAGVRVAVIVSVPGDCAELVESHGVGLACPPDDWLALADRFRQAAKLTAGERMEMGLRAGMVYRTLMSKRAGVDQLEDMLRVAAGVRRRLTASDDRRWHETGDHSPVAGHRPAGPDAGPRPRAHGSELDPMLSDVFFKELEIRTPDRYMASTRRRWPGCTPACWWAPRRRLQDVPRTRCCVLGDTNSCIAALMARRMKCPCTTWRPATGASTRTCRRRRTGAWSITSATSTWSTPSMLGGTCCGGHPPAPDPAHGFADAGGAGALPAADLRV
jgi:hypothetical protein